MSEDQLRPSPGGGGVDAEAESGRRHAPVMVEEAVRFLPYRFFVCSTALLIAVERCVLAPDCGIMTPLTYLNTYIAYLRKSSESEDRQTLSLPAQKDEILKLSKQLFY